MAKRMLIDATHAEETRVVVVDGTKLDEFDFETSTKKQLKGNIYLAKVTRVEPSLQAAFVDYGGNRHGFLAFNEIHPDYYQIPVSDREALLRQQKQEAAEAEARDEPRDTEAPEQAPEKPAAANGESADQVSESVETVSGVEEEEISRRPRVLQRYRIQEVIKRRQILLVQVTKEERGNKGAALTSYISLAGRYCVLMPNTTRGGGISRKIQSGEARKRLRSVVNSLSVPDGMAVILRTAGQERKKAEIKRDFDYLRRLWDEIRQTTLESTAPALIHEEANLIKRSIRDLYSANLEEVLVDGDEGYKVAKSFMRTLMPSHAKRVQPYRDHLPLFTRYQVDSQLDTMHSATMQLRSGGYIVINPTEALVAIDVNSGRATKERNIEETATATNLEAADEIARQLRLRDLAGLIVIDFIDMEDNRNIRQIERRLKEAVQSDRARIQMGRISSFGLLELSRQRLRPSLLEVSSHDCPYCAGSGKVRSVESAALHALRAIEDEGVRGRAAIVSATMPSAVALYLINHKREALSAIETQYDFRAQIITDDSPAPPECRTDIVEARAAGAAARRAAEVEVALASVEEAEEPRRRRSRRRKRPDEQDAVAEASGDTDAEAEATPVSAEEDGGDGETANGEKTRRRRRGRRGGRKRSRARLAQGEEALAPGEGEQPELDGSVINGAPEAVPVAAASEADAGEAGIVKPKRRRRTRKTQASSVAANDTAAPSAETRGGDGPESPGAVAESAPEQTKETEDSADAKPRRPRRRRSSGARKAAAEIEPTSQSELAPVEAQPSDEVPSPSPVRGNGDGDDAADGGEQPTAYGGAEIVESEGTDPGRRRGWWQRITGA